MAFITYCSVCKGDTAHVNGSCMSCKNKALEK